MTDQLDPNTLIEVRTYQNAEGFTLTAFVPMKDFGGQLLADADQQPMLLGKMTAEGVGPNGQKVQQAIPFPIGFDWSPGMGMAAIVRAGFANYKAAAEAAQQEVIKAQREAQAGIITPQGRM